MNSRKYWERRAAQDMYDHMETAEGAAAEMNAAIRQTSAYLEKEVKAVMRGMQSFISEAEAKKILNASGDGSALQRLRKAAQQVGDPKRREALLNAINSAGAYRYRIMRIEELSRDINRRCRELYKTENRRVTSALRSVAQDSYYREIFSIQKGTGLGFSFANFSQRDVDRILRSNWVGGNYSNRIWKDVNGMTERLKSELLVSMLSGRSGEKTARIFRERFGVNAFCARRIVRTESAYVANAAQKSAYSEAGIDRYRFVATLDSRTCECCAALDGKVFDLAKAKAGTNYPPMHPFCRSTTIADFGEDTLDGLQRRAKDKDGKTVKVSAGMTYEEWKELYVPNAGQKTLDKSAGSGIIEAGSGGKLEQAKTRDKKIAITDMAIEKANAPDIPYFTLEQNQKFKELNKELLRTAKFKNDSNEVAILFDPVSLTYHTSFGGVSSVNILDNPMARDMIRNADEKSLFLLHNHPSTKTFSYTDIGVLLTNDNYGGMTAVANNGVVNTIYKTSRYDRTLALKAIKSIRQEYPEKLSGSDDIAIVKRFLKISESCGIETL